MTTTVWYGKEKILFSDRQMGSRKVDVCKIIPVCNGWLTGAGDYDVLQEVALWAEENGGFGEGPRPTRTEWDERSLNTDILFVNDRAEALMITLPYLRAIPISEDIWATGTGGDLAHGALAACGDILTAMSIAHRYDVGTGDTFDVLNLTNTTQPSYVVKV